MNFEPEIIMAYVDDELDLVTARRIEKAMESDAALAARIAAERALKAKLSARFDPIAAEPVPDRLTALLRNVDTSLADRREAKRNRAGFGSFQWAAIAASLIVGLLIGKANLTGTGAQVSERNGILVASTDLKTALDTQLASNQQSNASAWIGLTFRDKAGTICRTFESRSLTGVACRDGNEWQLRQTRSTSGEIGTYRQAASSEVAEYASTMMAGEAFDAEAERAALKAQWK